MAHNVITIARGYGSGGKTVGKRLAQQLGIAYYDRDLIRIASEESGINERLFGQVDERVKGSLFKKGSGYRETPASPESGDFVSDDNLFALQAQTIRRLAEEQSCVIVGRCGDFVLRDHPGVVRVFIHACKEACIRNIVEMYGVSEKEAERDMERIDRTRSAYYRYYTGHDWDNARNYDLCLDSSRLGYDKCVEIIEGYLTVRNR